MDMENLNALLAEVPDIVDKPGMPVFAFDKEATRLAGKKCVRAWVFFVVLFLP